MLIFHVGAVFRVATADISVDWRSGDTRITVCLSIPRVGIGTANAEPG